MLYRTLLICLLLCLPMTAAARSPFEAKQVCDAIAQRHAVATKPMQTRTLNFLLFDSAGRGCDPLVAQFLEEGASVTARDRFGNTALSHAARGGHISTAELLLAADSDIGHQNLAGSSVLLRAVTTNRRRMVKMLLAAGADPNIANNRQITPLVTAAYNGEKRMLDILLAAGADPTAIDASGKGPIVYAAGRGFTKIAEALLDAGVDPNAIYANDLTVLMWAAGHSNDVPEAEGLETVQLLLDRGAKIDAIDNRGRSALMIAAERGHAAAVTLLLEQGADPARQDKSGKDALALAASEEVQDLLQAARAR